MMEKSLVKLEWPTLLGALSSFARTQAARDYLQQLQPNLNEEQIEERWSLVEPLKLLAIQGYRAPVGELQNLTQVFRAGSVGQVLSGEDLRLIWDLLDVTQKVSQFASDFGDRCTTLRKFKARLYPIPTLAQGIDKAVGPDGQLNDDASEELKKIRRQKISVRKKIEEVLRKILHEGELEKYLQDDFYTIRSERYVVPMRLDGRGRVKGSILDTSDSGQTLFIEPQQIAPINDQLQELDLAEKLEILRIFRELSEQVNVEISTLTDNYDQLVELDKLSAMAQLAHDQDAGRVQIGKTPSLNMVGARHPLVKRPDGNPAVGNSIRLSEDQLSLIISGPNAGGKTVVLKTVGLLHIMIKAGLLIPANVESTVYLYDDIFIEMGDAQSLSANLSTFSGHILGLKPIVEEATKQNLVLLDELAVGTDPQTGASIAQAILEELARRGATTLVTTHFDTLKGLAISDKRFRNGSMEFNMSNLKPTYKLILDVPGQSYGIEVAEEMGIPAQVLDRAKELRGATATALDDAVNQLMTAREEARAREQELAQARMEAETEKGRWEQERELMASQRAKAAESLKQNVQDEISALKAEYDEIIKDLRKASKEKNIQSEDLIASRHAAQDRLKDMDEVVANLAKASEAGRDLPGHPAEYEHLRENSLVFVLPLKKQGSVAKLSGPDSPIEVQVGMIKLKVSIHDLRLMEKKPIKKPQSRQTPRAQKPQAKLDHNIKLTLQTHTNSIDLRGKDADSAIEAAWTFIDKALLRGESSVILIHGHGEGVLVRALREALQKTCPYDIRYRPGQDAEGGDGVTVIELKL